MKVENSAARNPDQQPRLIAVSLFARTSARARGGADTNGRSLLASADRRASLWVLEESVITIPRQYAHEKQAAIGRRSRPVRRRGAHQRKNQTHAPLDQTRGAAFNAARSTRRSHLDIRRLWSGTARERLIPAVKARCCRGPRPRLVLSSATPQTRVILFLSAYFAARWRRRVAPPCRRQRG